MHDPRTPTPLTELVGVRTDRPPPPVRRWRATDWNVWRMDRLREEEEENLRRLEAHRGTCELVQAHKRARVQATGRLPRRQDLDPDDPVDMGRRKLVDDRVATLAQAIAMDAAHVLRALQDLDRRRAAMEALGLRADQEGWKPPPKQAAPQPTARQDGRSGQQAAPGTPGRDTPTGSDVGDRPAEGEESRLHDGVNGASVTVSRRGG